MTPHDCRHNTLHMPTYIHSHILEEKQNEYITGRYDGILRKQIKLSPLIPAVIIRPGANLWLPSCPRCWNSRASGEIVDVITPSSENPPYLRIRRCEKNTHQNTPDNFGRIRFVETYTWLLMEKQKCSRRGWCLVTEARAKTRSF